MVVVIRCLRSFRAAFCSDCSLRRDLDLQGRLLDIDVDPFSLQEWSVSL